MRVSQRQLAAAAGVSVSTVSLVYSGSGKIGAATRARVLACAEQFGYRPVPGLSATRTRTGRAPVPGSTLLVWRDADAGQRRYADAVLGANDRLFIRQAEARGYLVETLDAAGMDAVGLRQALLARRACAVVVPMVPVIAPELLRELQRWPAAGLMTQVLEPGLPLVETDDLMHAHAVMRQVLARGYRRPAILVADVPESRGTVARLGGLLAAGGAPILVPCHDPTVAVAVVQRHCCDSVIAATDGQLRKLRAVWRGIDQLGRAAIVVFEDNRTCAGMRNQPELLHGRLLDLLDRMLRHHLVAADLADLRAAVGFPWQEGRSLGVPLPASGHEDQSLFSRR
jgi:hypothetical protein